MKAVNLIPNQQRGPARTAAAGTASPPSAGGDGFGAYVILGVLALAVVAAALYVMAGNRISDKKAELATVSAEVEQVQQQAASLQAFADFNTLATARKQTVHDLAVGRFAWPEALDDVSRALPKDVYVSLFEGDTSASGGSSIRGAISAPAIALTGCARDQATVAELMSRLRNVRGVTRVSLAKSTKGELQQSTATTSTTTATGPDGEEIAPPKTVSLPCPAGSPPMFEMVAFFERAQLGTGAQPNTAAGGVAGPTGPAGAPTGPTGASGSTTTPASTTTTP